MGKERIEWLAVLRGLNIVLVVMFHVQLVDMTTGQNHAFCTLVSQPFSPFRMPLFIFCSGGLLYLSRIRKEWPVGELYIDKVKRIVVPFLFFVTFYYFFKLSLNSFVKTKVPFSVGHFLESFCIYYDHPSAHLWFLAVLSWMMLLYPLFRWLCRSATAMTVFLLFTMAVYFLDFDVPAESNYFFLFSLHKYLVFFFSGIYFFRFGLYSYFKRPLSVVLTIGGYVISCWYEIPLVRSLMGILMMIALAHQLAQRYPTLFANFREYIYQIFLMSFIFQPFVELVLWRRLFYNEQLFLVFYVLNVLSGIYLPVLVSKMVERSRLAWLKMCLGLKA